MNKRYFTVGVKYKYEEHPTIPQATPDGWIEVRGADAEQARALVMALAGKNWAFDYSEEDFDPSYHPEGPFLVITVETP